MKKDPASSKSSVREFFRTEEDLAPLFKSLLTFSSQHAPSDSTNRDAVTVLVSVINIVGDRKKPLTRIEQERVIDCGVDYLCRIPIESIDTSAFKPVREETRVVSISDVEDSFDSKEVDGVIIAIRDLLSLMDNKHYFMEIMHRIALRKSVSSILLAAATSRAIETMGWQNNFTSFLIHHLVIKMFYDHVRFEFNEDVNNGEGLFEKSLSHIQTLEDAQFISALFRMYNESKILSNKIRPMVLNRLRNSFDFGNNINNFNSDDFSPIERILFHSCIRDLGSIDGSEELKQKIPFVV